MEKPDIVTRLETILANVQRLRSSIYPPGYDADPWHLVEKDIERLLNDVKPG